MDDFRKFALEQFGKEIYFKKSDKIDTFESLFGASFVGHFKGVTMCVSV